jgi:aminoglycoside 3-N-acetyltransferase
MWRDGLDRLKKPLRAPYRGLRARYIRCRHGFSEADFRKALSAVGLSRGDTVMVHSAMTGFAGFAGDATDIIRILEDTVSADGALLMPTFTWLGDMEDFIATGRVFDPRTTPSQVGLLPEIFRRSAGVVRSVHPTHSIAAWGWDAAWWIHDHHLAETPCGRGSAFARLLERGAKILLAGVDITACSFFHCAEELLEAQMPESPFTAQRYVLQCRVDGRMVDTAPMRFYDPGMSRRRRTLWLADAMRRAGRWREARTGSLNLIGLRVADLLRTLQEMAARGEFCYLPR